MTSPRDTGRQRRRGVLALVLLALAWAFVMQALGWAQTSYFALVKSLGDGTAHIDRYHWETRDKAWTGGHFFSVKAPGMPFAVLPLYEALERVGAPAASRGVARAAHRTGDSRWAYHALLVHAYGYDPARARRVRDEIEGEAPIVWALTLFGAGLPAFGLLLLVRGLAERVRPGTGTAAALLLGAGTIVMVFASELFGHMLATFLGFAAFAVAWRERDGPPRLWLVAAAGVLSGLAVVTEYPLFIAGAIVGLYAIARPGWVRRAVVYAGGVAAGLVPLALYNQWAFGDVAHLSYADAVDRQGYTGHWTLGLNDGGVFGIGVPHAGVALQLLVSSRGMLALSPVLFMGVVGTWLLHRHGRRAEALTVAAISVCFLAYDAGYWLPFGGGTPGPRFLIPVLPFLCLGLGLALRRFPAMTLGLAAPSLLTMLLAVGTYPLIGDDDVGLWVRRVEDGILTTTPLVPLGVTGWLSVLPLLALVAAALFAGMRATERLDRAAVRADLVRGALAVAGWGVIAGAAPALWHGGDAVVTGNWQEGVMVGAGMLAGWATIGVLALRAGVPVGSRARAGARRSARTQVVEHEHATDLAS